MMPTPKIDTGNEVINNSVNRSLPAGDPAASINPMQILMYVYSLIWLLGAISVFTFSVFIYLRSITRLKTAILYKDNNILLAECSQKLKMKRKVLIYTSDRINTPVVHGFIKPRIILPLFLTQSENEKVLQHIVTHELIHIKRLDYIIKPLAVVALCVHWFNPLIWLSFKLSQKDMEMSCDEKVMSTWRNDIRNEYV